VTEPTKEAVELAVGIRSTRLCKSRFGHWIQYGIQAEEAAAMIEAYAAQRVAEAIERCAQIAEDRALTVAGHEAGVIACLIRYLKEPGR
jgi:hypothetical protein